MEDIGLMVNARSWLWSETTAVWRLLRVARRATTLLTVTLLLVVSSAACVSNDERGEPRSVVEGARRFALVIANGRVIDPETGLDAVRYIGIEDGTIVALSEAALDITDDGLFVDAGQLVVAPGFIDLHAHGQDVASSRYQAMDGVTTALELEVGVFPVDRWYDERGGEGLILSLIHI